LAIARALVRRPSIYLFDEAFSALDLATDARLRAALRPVTRDAAVIVVASRISTIADFDQIVVLNAGVVVGIGRHEELLRTCPTYAEIVTSQLSAEDAACVAHTGPTPTAGSHSGSRASMRGAPPDHRGWAPACRRRRRCASARRPGG
jgi:ABC-type multidrug transport system ATPase subunit